MPRFPKGGFPEAILEYSLHGGTSTFGGSADIAPGIKDSIAIPFDCTITSATLLAAQTGSIVIDIWKCSYAQFDNTTHPVDADSITSSTPPTISSANKSQDSSLTGWTTSISANDVLRFNVDSCTDIKECILVLKMERT